MALDLQEQEQLADLKSFWMSYGRWLAIGLLISLIGYGLYWFYVRYQNNVAVEASLQYEELLKAAVKSDLPAVVKKAEELQKNYAGTAYAGMAGLLAANLAYSTNDIEGASAQLKWVEEKSNSASFQSLARIRLATLLMDQKEATSITKAQELLNKKVAPGYEALQLERQGDLMLIQDKTDEAKKAYLKAWEVIDQQKAKQAGVKELDVMAKETGKRNPSENQRLLKVKIDSLGGF